MIRKLGLVCLTLTATLASAASYNVTLYQDSNIAGKQLKAGTYKLELKDNSATLKHNKEVTEVPMRTETSNSKYSSTMVRLGKDNQVQEICLGGSKTKVVFAGGSPTANGVQ